MFLRFKRCVLGAIYYRIFMVFMASIHVYLYTFICIRDFLYCLPSLLSFLYSTDLVYEPGGQLPEPHTERDQPAKGLVFFPSISLVNSMPVIPEHAMEMTKHSSWDAVRKGGRRLDDRVKSAKSLVRTSVTHE